MIPVAEAIQIVIDNAPRLASERVPLISAPGRILAEDVIADSDLPPFNRSQMDGYAVRAVDTQTVPARLRIVGESAAGKGWHKEIKAGEAVRIMTGAPVPEGADAVQQVELTRESPDRSEVEILESVASGRSIVKRANEVSAGSVVMRTGDRVTANTIAVLASFGYSGPLVACRPRVAVAATGSELVPVDQTPGPDQIRDSNNFSIAAYARLCGADVELLPLVSDDPNELHKNLSAALERADVLVTSGGVSMGVYDYTKAALRDIGGKLLFERVALRPGKPTVFGSVGSHKLVFGLPGNPVSVSVTFNLFVRPALLAMQQANVVTLEEGSASLTHAVKAAKDRDSYLPAKLSTSSNGQLLATPLKWGGSSDFVSFADAQALVHIPVADQRVAAGSVVNYLRLTD
jgi:molybdenum cofactor synthesis domain-containing protein